MKKESIGCSEKAKASNEDNPLTEREMEVLRLIAEGKTNSEIGDKLFISPRTVDTHRRNILQKLNLHSAVQLTRYAHKHGIIINSLIILLCT